MYVPDINNCAQHPCHNGGECVYGVDSFTCSCADGYTGPFCQTSEYTYLPVNVWIFTQAYTDLPVNAQIVTEIHSEYTALPVNVQIVAHDHSIRYMSKLFHL